MKKSETKSKWLHLRLSEADYKQLHTEFSKTTERKISTYSRKILLSKPMIAGYRNHTADVLMIEFSKLIKDLNGVANNFNQAVHVLHTLKHHSQFAKWLAAYQSAQNLLLTDIRSIREFIHKTASVWSQS
ncbi:plasmid mobilization relaxosome protein MobC [Chitinophaga sp. CC14]|uniref:plasmid mobilization relaxosome protein MobC n=1 Tax=Chitinophaga sp. CC14 TaxID=3029199 RepID=UPI003B7BEB29